MGGQAADACMLARRLQIARVVLSGLVWHTHSLSVLPSCISQLLLSLPVGCDEVLWGDIQMARCRSIGV